MAAKFWGVGKLGKGKQKLGKLWNAAKHLFETFHIPINMIRSLITADSIMIMFERGIREKAQSLMRRGSPLCQTQDCTTWAQEHFVFWFYLWQHPNFIGIYSEVKIL